MPKLGIEECPGQVRPSLNADHSVAEFTTIFAPRDTVHLSVLTATDFPLQSAGGFPPGQYSAEVFLDVKSVETRTFKVQ